MSDKPVTEGGERPGARKATEDLIRRMVGSGYTPAQAERKAAETARDYDRRNK